MGPRSIAAAIVIVGIVYCAPVWLMSGGSSWSVLDISSSSGQQQEQQAWTLPEPEPQRRLQQNDFSGSTIPPKFTQLDRAAETQRIYRSVAQERCASIPN